MWSEQIDNPGRASTGGIRMEEWDLQGEKAKVSLRADCTLIKTLLRAALWDRQLPADISKGSVSICQEGHGGGRHEWTSRVSKQWYHPGLVKVNKSSAGNKQGPLSRLSGQLMTQPQTSEEPAYEEKQRDSISQEASKSQHTKHLLFFSPRRHFCHGSTEARNDLHGRCLRNFIFLSTTGQAGQLPSTVWCVQRNA